MTDNVKCDPPEISAAREDGRRRGYRAGVMDAIWYLEHAGEFGDVIGKLLAKADEVDPRPPSIAELPARGPDNGGGG